MASAEAAGLPIRATWSLIWVRQNADVWSLAGSPDSPTLAFVKHGQGPEVRALQAETDRLVWLETNLLDCTSLVSPKVLAATTVADDQFLLATSALNGTGGQDLDVDQLAPPRLGVVLGEALASLHESLSVDSCPWSLTIADTVDAGRARLAQGRLQREHLPPPFLDSEPVDAVRWLADHAPEERDQNLVVTHGDAGLPNLLVPDDVDAPLGVIDVGRLAVSDRYRDLSVLLRSFDATYGPQYLPTLLQAYGIDPLDELRLDWWRIADDLW